MLKMISFTETISPSPLRQKQSDGVTNTPRLLLGLTLVAVGASTTRAFNSLPPLTTHSLHPQSQCLLQPITPVTTVKPFTTTISNIFQRQSHQHLHLSLRLRPILKNILRDYAAYNDDDDGVSTSGWNNPNRRWKTTQYPFGNTYRDAETNPYYDPGWAQSIRRDNPNAIGDYNSPLGYGGGGYGDGYGRNFRDYNNAYNSNTGSRMMDDFYGTGTYPGMKSGRSQRFYSNPTNPYYDPVWSQSMARNEVPISGRRSERMIGKGGGYGGGYGMGGMYGGGSYYPNYGMGGRYGVGSYYPNYGFDVMGGMDYNAGFNTGNNRYDDGYGGPYAGNRSMMYASGRNDGNTGNTAGISYGNNKSLGKSMLSLNNRNATSGMFLRSRTYTPTSTSLRSSFYDPEFDGPPFDRLPYPPGPYGPMGPMGRMGVPGRPLRDLAVYGGDTRFQRDMNIPPPPEYEGRNPRMMRGMNMNRMNPNYFRRNPIYGRGPGGPGGPRGPGGMGGYNGRRPPTPNDPFLRQSLRESSAWSTPFGRDDAPARTSLKDMAARVSTSFDAMAINEMNKRQPRGSGKRRGEKGEKTDSGDGSSSSGDGIYSGGTSYSERYSEVTNNGRSDPPGFVGFAPPGAWESRKGGDAGPGGGGAGGMGGGAGPMSSMSGMNSMSTRPSPTSNLGPVGQASTYVPLNALSEMSRPMTDYNMPMDPAMMMDLPPTIHVARIVRPSVVLVTSVGVRNENSQGSGFVVEFDDSMDDYDIDEDDDDRNDRDEDEPTTKERCYLLTSAHVAPPGWKISVNFPSQDRDYPATVVGRNLNCDLALLRVETKRKEGEEFMFPPPLVLSSEDVVTATLNNDSEGSGSVSSGIGGGGVPQTEIGSPLYAFGYPLGVEGPTMTSGILSATTKGISYFDSSEGQDSSSIEKKSSMPFEGTSFVITDAAMAGGMSGGPLVNYDGIVLGVNALVRPDLRALGNYAVSALECEMFLQKLEEQCAADAAAAAGKELSGSDGADGESIRRKKKALKMAQGNGVAGFRVMLYGGPMTKTQIASILRKLAKLDESRANSVVQSNYSFGAGVVDEFYVADNGGERAMKAAKKSADDLQSKLKNEGLLVEVEPIHLLK